MRDAVIVSTARTPLAKAGRGAFNATHAVELGAFSVRNLAMLDGVFESFFRTYEQYQLNLASWDAKYGPRSSSTAVSAAPSTK